jgi:lysophospholipase L1-like esterase
MKSTFLVSALLAALSVASSSSLFAHSAVEPVPRGDEWWRNRHKSINENVAKLGREAQVIFIGDSITQGWEGAGREVWERYYAPRKAINLGIGGDRTQHVLWRLDNGNLEGIEPKAAVVMIGTNNSNGEDNSVEQIADGVTAIVKKLREKLPSTKVLLVAIFPRSENPSPQRGKILQVNQIIRKLADNQNVFWVDFGHKFVKSNGAIPAELMPDYLHLSPAGYQIWAESIESRLARILGESPRGSRSQSSNASSSGVNLSGNWTASIPGPEGRPVFLPFTLAQEGNRLTGALQRPEGGELAIQNGRVNGRAFSWVVKRDRPDGSVMTYDMTGELKDEKLIGKAVASIDDNQINLDWTAERRR